MTRIRCRERHCTFNRSGICTSVEIEYEPDAGCLTMETREDAEDDEEEFEDEELEDLDEDLEDEADELWREHGYRHPTFCHQCSVNISDWGVDTVSMRMEFPKETESKEEEL